jgi:hypothetical protein
MLARMIRLVAYLNLEKLLSSRIPAGYTEPRCARGCGRERRSLSREEAELNSFRGYL